MVMKLESMSKNIVSILLTLANNEQFCRILALDVKNPYNPAIPSPSKEALLKSNGEQQRLFPYPFDLEATTLDGSFVRVYYNDFDFNSNEVISEARIHIDIVVSKSLWLINNGSESLIRAYDLAGRIVDLIGKRSIGNHRKFKVDGGSHLYINTKFDCIRLYIDYMSVESGS